MARLTGLEPATPGVTGRYSNQLSYNRVTFRLGNRRGGVNRGLGGFWRVVWRWCTVRLKAHPTETRPP